MMQVHRDKTGSEEDVREGGLLLDTGFHLMVSCCFLCALSFFLSPNLGSRPHEEVTALPRAP
jgi:hypothetical protein